MSALIQAHPPPFIPTQEALLLPWPARAVTLPVMKRKDLNPSESDTVIRMAWHDRTSFDEIRERTGLSEADVIQHMRLSSSPQASDSGASESQAASPNIVSSSNAGMTKLVTPPPLRKTSSNNKLIWVYSNVTSQSG